MSRTKRKVVQGGFGDDNGSVVVMDETKAKHQKRGDWCKPKKLKPYMRGDVPYKGKHKRGEHHSMSNGQLMGNTNTGSKLAVNNSNRSLKKGLRQQLKKDLKKEL